MGRAIRYGLLAVLLLRAMMFESVWVPASFFVVTLLVIGAGLVFKKEAFWVIGFIVLSSLWLVVLPTIGYEFAQSHPFLAEAMKERVEWTEFWAENKARPSLSPRAQDLLRQYSKGKREAIETQMQWLLGRLEQYKAGKISTSELREAEETVTVGLHKLGLSDSVVEEVLGPTRFTVATTSTIEVTTSLLVTTTTETTLPEPTSTTTTTQPLARQNEVDSDYVKREREEMRSIADQFRATWVQVEGDGREPRRYYDLSSEVVIILNPKDQKKINFTGDKFSGKVERPVDIDGRREIEPGTKLTGKVAASGDDFWLLRLDLVKGKSGRLIHFVSSRVKRSYPKSEFSHSVWDELAPWPTSGRKEIGARVRFRIVKIKQ